MIALGGACLTVVVAGMWIGPYAQLALSIALFTVCVVAAVRIVHGVKQSPNWIEGYSEEPEKPVPHQVDPQPVQGRVLNRPVARKELPR